MSLLYKLQAKIPCLILFLFLSMGSIQAQEYHHGFGAQIDLGIFVTEYDSQIDGVYSDEQYPIISGVMYKATLGFSDHLALSAYPYVGFSANFSSFGGVNGSFGLQLPVVAEYYAGDIDGTGFIIGAGFAYGYLGTTTLGGGDVLGPQLGLGGQFEARGRLMGIRISYTHGIAKSNVISEVPIIKDTQRIISGSLYTVIGS